jgi:NAD(P)-dependent dehydrogenase (short-subunit alcohol dehydrogenase family)
MAGALKVVVTGASSGIGRATAIGLARRGYLVFAAARRPRPRYVGAGQRQAADHEAHLAARPARRPGQAARARRLLTVTRRGRREATCITGAP